ncbi:MAG: RNA polymerase sigma factor SigZ [bacterium]|nr:RNA polymerase sigma factor SigZ [bacterium]
MVNLETLWEIYSERLGHFIRTRVSDPGAAEDILQDVFLRTYTRLGTLRDDQKFESWMYQITRNAVVDYYRTRKPQSPLPEDLAEQGNAEGAREHIVDCLVPMIEHLPVHYREAVMLSEIEGLPHKAVAEQQGVSLAAAKSRVLRGRQMLKELLLDCCRFEFDVRGRMMDYEQRCGCEEC